MTKQEFIDRIKKNIKNNDSICNCVTCGSCVIKEKCVYSSDGFLAIQERKKLFMEIINIERNLEQW